MHLPQLADESSDVLLEDLGGLDGLPQGIADYGLQVGVVLGEIVVGIGNRDALQVESNGLQVVVEEGVGNRLVVVVEDREDRALGFFTEARPQGEALLEVLAHQVEVALVGAQVPFHRKVDEVVDLSDVEALVEVGGSELSARGGFLEDLPEVAGLGSLQVLPQVGHAHAAPPGLSLEVGDGRRVAELVVVEFPGDVLGLALRPRCERGENPDVRVGEAQKSLAQLEVLRVDAILFSQ
ncbi:hypothetical protein D3C86_578160 [compost metagenome]